MFKDSWAKYQQKYKEKMQEKSIEKYQNLSEEKKIKCDRIGMNNKKNYLKMKKNQTNKKKQVEYRKRYYENLKNKNYVFCIKKKPTKCVT